MCLLCFSFQELKNVWTIGKFSKQNGCKMHDGTFILCVCVLAVQFFCRMTALLTVTHFFDLNFIIRREKRRKKKTKMSAWMFPILKVYQK